MLNLTLQIRLQCDHKLGRIRSWCTQSRINNTKSMQEPHVWQHVHLSVSCIHLCHLNRRILEHSIYKTKSKYLRGTIQQINTCSIFSSKHLHINSHRLRTEARDARLMPTALADCEKKSRAKLRLITVTRGWRLGILLSI